MRDQLGSGIPIAAEKRIHKAIVPLGPGQFEIVAYTSDGQYIGRMTIVVTSKDSFRHLADALAGLMQQVSPSLVVTSQMPQ